MRRVVAIAVCLMLVILSGIGVTATSLPRIIDRADTLTSTQEAQLEEQARYLSDTYETDVVILTIYSLGGKSVEAFADDYFDEMGYGVGSEYSGVLLLLSLEYRDWAISTCGDTRYALSDYEIQQLFSEIAAYLSQNQYYQAFDTYLQALVPYLDTSTPIDSEMEDYDGPGSFVPGTQEDVVFENALVRHDVLWYLQRIGMSFIIGAVVALTVLLIMRSKMNTAKAQRNASSYVVGGTPDITRHQDIFLYSQVRKMKKPEPSTGGGSSVHHSSSGRSHGGGHGKF